MFSGRCVNQKGRNRILSLSMVAALALTVGVSAFTPAVASAATCPELTAGQVVKVVNKNVFYLVGSQGELKKYINTEAMLTWQPDANKVVKAKAECLKEEAIGDDIGYRPGSRIVKFDRKFYAVGPNNLLYQLATPAIAKSIYGANWRAYSRNISKDVFLEYTVGSAVEAGVLHDGMLVKKANSKTVYLVENGTLKKVEGVLSKAARNDVRALNAKMFATLNVDDSSTVEAKEVVVAPISTSVVVPSTSLEPTPSPAPVSLEPTPSPGPVTAAPATPVTTPATPPAPVASTDGWMVYTNGLSGLSFGVSVPSADKVKSVTKGSKDSKLGADSYTMDIYADKLGKNIDRIDLAESSDPADIAYEPRAYAEVLYTSYKNALEGASVGAGLPPIHCAWPTPSYETKTLGGNSWVILSYMDGCSGGQFVYPVYKQWNFAVSKVNGKMNVLFINNSNIDVRTPGTNDMNSAKAVNTSFLDEFLGKLKF